MQRGGGLGIVHCLRFVRWSGKIKAMLPKTALKFD